MTRMTSSPTSTRPIDVERLSPDTTTDVAMPVINQPEVQAPAVAKQNVSKAVKKREPATVKKRAPAAKVRANATQKKRTSK